MLKQFFTTLVLTLALALPTQAQDVVVTLAPPAEIVEVGGDARFIVTITNNTATDLSGQLFLTEDGGYPSDESDSFLKDITVKAGETAVFYPTIHGADVWGPDMLVGVVVRLGGIEYRVGEDDRVSPTFARLQVAVSFGADGWTTFYDEDHNLTVPDGVSAYIVTAVTDGGVALSPVTVIPAYTPVLLKGEGTVKFDEYEGNDAEDIYDQLDRQNRLNVGSWFESGLWVEADEVGSYWLVDTVDGQTGFRQNTEEGILPPSAFFVKATLTTTSTFLSLTDILTGLKPATAVGSQTAPAYTLSGRRVAPSARGLVLVDGRKVLRR